MASGRLLALETRQKKILKELWTGIRTVEETLATTSEEAERQRLEGIRGQLQEKWTMAEQMLRELLVKKQQLRISTTPPPPLKPEVVKPAASRTTARTTVTSARTTVKTMTTGGSSQTTTMERKTLTDP